VRTFGENKLIRGFVPKKVKPDTGLVLATVALLILMIVLAPDEFLFSKTYGGTFWYKYFPGAPLTACWFLTIVALTPVLYGIDGVRNSFKYCLIAAVISVSIGVPCAMLLEGERIHFNSLTTQFVWAGIFNVLPGVLFSAVIKLYALVIAGKR
jgi:hypothetical protein